jgi:hypothetical protein
MNHGLVSNILQHNVGSRELCASCMIIWSADVWLGAAGSSVGRQQHQKKRVSVQECQGVWCRGESGYELPGIFVADIWVFRYGVPRGHV